MIAKWWLARPGLRLWGQRPPPTGSAKRRKATREAVRSPLTPTGFSRAYPAHRGQDTPTRRHRPPVRAAAAVGLKTAPQARPKRDEPRSALRRPPRTHLQLACRSLRALTGRCAVAAQFRGCFRTRTSVARGGRGGRATAGGSGGTGRAGLPP